MQILFKNSKKSIHFQSLSLVECPSKIKLNLSSLEDPNFIRKALFTFIRFLTFRKFSSYGKDHFLGALLSFCSYPGAIAPLGRPLTLGRA
jgi:hypothetical protein